MRSIVIDANNAILGRLASFAAKQALLGKNVIIVNCSEAVVSGGRDSVIADYRETKARGGSSLKGPFMHRAPFKMVKRTIRGMLKHREGRGNEALKRIMCYNDTPEEYKEVKKLLAGKEKKVKTIKLGELSKAL